MSRRFLIALAFSAILSCLVIRPAAAMDLRAWVGTWRVVETSNTGYTKTRMMHLRLVQGVVVSDGDGPLAAAGNQLKWQLTSRDGSFSYNLYTMVGPGRATVRGGVRNASGAGSVMWTGTAVRVGY